MKSELEDVFLYNKICLQQIYWQVMECITFKCTTLPIAKKEMWHCTLCDFTLTTSIWLDFCRRGGSDKFCLFLPSPHILGFRFTKWIWFECTPKDHLAALPTAANLCANFISRTKISVPRPGKRREAEDRKPELLISNKTTAPNSMGTLKIVSQFGSPQEKCKWV